MPVSIFISYSLTDADHHKKLEKHLSPLRTRGLIEVWHDLEVLAGEDRQREIDEKLRTADVLLLLVSADFLSSPFCSSTELQQVIDAGAAQVIPILVRACDWEGTPFGHLDVLPNNGRAIASWETQDEAWTDVVKGLARRIKEAPLSSELDDAAKPTSNRPKRGTRTLKRALAAAYVHKEELVSEGADPSAAETRILELRRLLRQGDRLEADDFLGDGRFRLVKEIGRGGFGVVWLAIDQKIRHQGVAIKVLHGQHLHDLSRRERFFRGARKMAELNHPGIVRVIEPEVKDGGKCFFVMEHVSGGDLRHAVLKDRLPQHEGLRIVMEVGEALTFAHGKNMVHRDIKPANILLDHRKQPKLTDFDLVRAFDTTGGTRTGNMLGTFLYAAPECQTNPNDATAVADIFSLGMTALFAIHGRELNWDVLRKTSEFLDALDCDPAVRQVLEKAIAWEKQNRFDSMADFCHALRNALPPTPSNTSDTPRAVTPSEQDNSWQMIPGPRGIAGPVRPTSQKTLRLLAALLLLMVVFWGTSYFRAPDLEDEPARIEESSNGPAQPSATPSDESPQEPEVPPPPPQEPQLTDSLLPDSELPASASSEESPELETESLPPAIEASNSQPEPATLEQIPESGGGNLCLALIDLSEDSVQVSLRLGRVISDGRTREPVLIKQIAEGYGFRNCSGSEPEWASIRSTDLELFNNALVAHFPVDKTGFLTTYHELTGMNYEAGKEAVLAFSGSGAMLEARRLDREHVEITTTDSMRYLPVSVILLVVSREVLTQMAPAVWDEVWGSEPEDERISRRISWWELELEARVRVHDPVSSFEELARQLGEPSNNPAIPFRESKLALQNFLVGDAKALIVVEERRHVALAEAMFEQAANTDVELDVATLEDLWGPTNGYRTDPNLTRMEKASVRGRFLTLVRYYDLAAIMPGRIASKLRRNYLQASSENTGVTEFSNRYVTLKADPDVFQVGNLIFQDQAAGMKKLVSFLSCLLDSHDTAYERHAELIKGMERMGIPLKELDRMNFNQAFQYLFQSFSLPPGLRVGERNFLRSVGNRDAEAVRLVSSLQDFLDTKALDTNAVCDGALIPDTVPQGEWAHTSMHVVSSTTKETSIQPPSTPTNARGLLAKVQYAKFAAHHALREAIYARGAKYVRRKIVKGHEHLDLGSELLKRASDDETLRAAEKAFEQARKLFEDATKLSIKIQSGVEPIRVF